MVHIGVYRAQKQGYGHPLQLFMSRKYEERGKTTWGKYSLKKGKAQNLKYVFNKLNELLLWTTLMNKS